MRLFESILEANHRWVNGQRNAQIPRNQFADSLPVAALTCIDPRLNHLIPDLLGVPEQDFVWLRNAGNVITDPLSATIRSLVLACAIKGGKEIAIIGHTDCLVGKTTMLKITDSLQALGVDRADLPENLNEFFGLFASERQNVLKAVELVRQSRLIGPKVPVHGLLVDLPTGRLEWLVNGYQTTAALDSETALDATIGKKGPFETKLDLPAFQIGEMKFPDVKIGDLRVTFDTGASKPALTETESSQSSPAPPPPLTLGELAGPIADFASVINRALRYRIIDPDQKVHGPLSGQKLLQWLAEHKIDGKTPIQVEGSGVWQTLASLAEAATHVKTPVPPLIPRIFGNRTGKRK